MRRSNRLGSADAASTSQAARLRGSAGHPHTCAAKRAIQAELWTLRRRRKRRPSGWRRRMLYAGNRHCRPRHRRLAPQSAKYESGFRSNSWSLQTPASPRARAAPDGKRFMRRDYGGWSSPRPSLHRRAMRSHVEPEKMRSYMSHICLINNTLRELVNV